METARKRTWIRIGIGNVAGTALLLLLSAVHLWGQALTGTVVGTVTDQSGASAPGVTITLVNAGTNLTRTITTNSEGQFRADSFPTGALTVTATREGFNRLVRSGLQLTAADTITVDMQLTLGNAQQTVEVNAEGGMIQTQSAAVSNLITNTQMSETPLNGRVFTQMLVLSSGAVPNTPGLVPGLSSYGMRASTGISINGNTSQNNSYVLDGILNVAPWLNNLVLTPALDTIQETRLMGSNYSAEYGSAAGAVTVVQTKSGSNALHGGAYEFLRNNDLDANTFFNNRAGIKRPAYHRNQFGVNAGGPIRKDKTFFFADYEGNRIVQPATVTDTLPTAAQRQMVTTGNFSALGTTIFDPTTSVNGGPRTAFPGNLIPATQLDPAAAKLMTLLPANTTAGSANNFVWAPASRQRADQFDGRVDQNLGASDRLFLKFDYENTTGSGPGTVPVGSNPAVPVGPYAALGGGFAGSSQMKSWGIIGNYIKILNPTLVNEFRAGAVRVHLDNLLADNTIPAAQALGIPNINISDTNMGLPGITMSGFTSPLFGSTSSYPELDHSITYQVQDILTKVKGTHTLKFGMQFLRDQFNGHTSNSPRGVWDFNGAFTRQIGATSSATALSDFAMGAFDTAQRSQEFGIFGARRWRMSGFAEDAWRVNRRLTLTYGFRYELQGPWGDVSNRWSDLNVKTGTIITPTSANNQCGASMICLDHKVPAPRLGIVYLLTSDGKTVLRSGAGVSYFNGDNGGKMMHQNPPMSIIQQFAPTLNIAPVMTLSQGLPSAVLPNVNDPSQLTQLFYAWDPNMKLARSMQWSIGIQRELMSDLMLDVAYVGSRTNHMPNVVNANQLLPGTGPTAPRRPLYTVNPVIGDISFRTNYGSAKYHSLQVNLTKRYGHGLSGAVAYTWSHNMANTVGPNGNAYPQNDKCYACEWGSPPRTGGRCWSSIMSTSFPSAKAATSSAMVGWRTSSVHGTFPVFGRCTREVTSLRPSPVPFRVRWARPWSMRSSGPITMEPIQIFLRTSRRCPLGLTLPHFLSRPHSPSGTRAGEFYKGRAFSRPTSASIASSVFVKG